MTVSEERLAVHKHVEMAVDNPVNNHRKYAIIAIFHHIAQGLRNLNNAIN